MLLGRVIIAAALCCALPVLAAAQQAIAFGAAAQDNTLPVEVTADALSVNQGDGTAEFLGNVVIVQGEMRLSAPRVFVTYAEAQGQIRLLEATGGVTLVSGVDAAEAQRAEYTIDQGTIVMTGNVLLNQKSGTLASNRLEVNLTSGTAKMAGRVKTILNPNGGSN
mgnify:CR=1 FL=1